MDIKIIIITFFSFILSMNEVDQIYNEALEAYKNGQYELAIQNYEQVLSNDWESSILYYNLGNAYYQLNNISNSVWAYEQCLKLDPFNKDAEYNLKLANINVRDRIDIPNPPLILKIFINIKSSLTPSGWIRFWSLLIFLLSIIVLIRKIYEIKLFSLIEKIWIILFILSIIPGGYSISDSFSIQEGIILHPEIEVFSSPNTYSTKLFNVHEGLKINISDHSEGWYKIELIDGKIGWILDTDCRLLKTR